MASLAKCTKSNSSQVFVIAAFVEAIVIIAVANSAKKQNASI